ncbi:hypothetical protein HDU97_004780 [Phlyctochytrium planicorne]|nr:hypothetical protein HDU97_004780 [Phlyctochytrium planicorne]
MAANTRQQPFVPPDNKLFFGANYQAANLDYPDLMNKRIKNTPGADLFTGLSIFNAQANLREMGNVMDLYYYVSKIMKEVDATQTDAILLLSLTMEGPGRIGEVGNATSVVETWQRIYQGTLSFLTPETRPNVNFIWSPDCSNPGSNPESPDPFAPFYPGDNFVDWIGCPIIYVKDKPFPDYVNILPPGDFADNAMKGVYISQNPAIAPVKLPSVYELYSKAKNKPFMITKAGAGYNIDYTRELREQTGITDLFPKSKYSQSEVKRAFWRQILNTTFLEAYPQLKGVCMYETKAIWAGQIIYDTNVFGYPASNISKGAAEVIPAFIEDFKSMPFVIWAKDKAGNSAGPTSLQPSNSTSSSNASDSSKSKMMIGVIAGGAILLIIAVTAVILYRNRRSRRGSQTKKPLTTSNQQHLTPPTPISSIPNTATKQRNVESVKVETLTASTASSPIQNPNALVTPIPPPASVTRASRGSPTLDEQKDRNLFHRPASRTPSDEGPSQHKEVPSKIRMDMEQYGSLQRGSAIGESSLPETWSRQSVRQWLIESGVSEHIAEILYTNNITGRSLLTLTDTDLQRMRITQMTVRSMIMHLCNELNNRNQGLVSPGTLDRPPNAGDTIGRWMGTRTEENDAPPTYTD